MPIKRKISKRKTKTRRNSCLPCMGALNPSRKGVRRRNPDINLFPFLWTNPIGSKVFGLKEGKYYVVIANWEYKPLFDPFLTKTEKSKSQYVLTPDITVIKNTYEFDTEKEALNFIKKWWNK